MALAIEASSREEFFQHIKDGDPKSYVIFHDRIEAYADKFFPKLPEAYAPPQQDFVRVPLPMRQWVEEELPKRDRPKTLVVYGPSRTGKTSWARSLGQHCYVATYWNSTEVVETKDYIIFDDIPFETFHNWQAFMGVSLNP